MFDVDGHSLVQVNGSWRADDCHWGTARKRAARDGDVSALHGLIFHTSDETCAPGKLVSPARAARITTLVNSMAEVRAASPAFIKQLTLGDEPPEDLTNVIASNMSLDIEWPHIDRRFSQVYGTLPGYKYDEY